RPPGPRDEWGDRNEFTARPHGDDTERSVSGEMFPPGIEPLPGQEKRLRGTGLEEFAPLAPEFLKASRILYRFDLRRFGLEPLRAGDPGAMVDSGPWRCCVAASIATPTNRN